MTLLSRNQTHSKHTVLLTLWHSMMFTCLHKSSSMISCWTCWSIQNQYYHFSDSDVNVVTLHIAYTMFWPCWLTDTLSPLTSDMFHPQNYSQLSYQLKFKLGLAQMESKCSYYWIPSPESWDSLRLRTVDPSSHLSLISQKSRYGILGCDTDTGLSWVRVCTLIYISWDLQTNRHIDI